jgi:hypothetical protein
VVTLRHSACIRLLFGHVHQHTGLLRRILEISSWNSSVRIDSNYCQLARGITDLNPIIYQQICYKINKTRSKRQTLLLLQHFSTQPNSSKTPTLSLYPGDRTFEQGSGQRVSVLTFLSQFKWKPRYLATSRNATSTDIAKQLDVACTSLCKTLIPQF